MMPKILIDSLFWAFVLQLFFFAVDALSTRDFGSRTYTVFGFFITYLDAITIVWTLRAMAKKD